MKIKCPLCGCENYFTGLENGGAKFCSECNTPLTEHKNPDTTENPYIKINNGEANTTFLGSKKMLDKETFSDGLIGWVAESLKVKGKRNGSFQVFLRNILEFGADKVPEEKFIEEIYYFYIWMAYINCVDAIQNKNNINSYFSYFYKKMYELVFKRKYGRYKEEEWIKILTQKLNGYIDAYNLFIKGDSIFSKSALGREFYKNLYGKESLDLIKNYIFTTFVTEELKFSFRTLLKGLMRCKI